MKNGGTGDVEVAMNTPNLTELATALASLSPADRDAVLAEAFSLVAQENAKRSRSLFRVTLATPGDREGKVNLIKALRQATGYGLGEAKLAVVSGAVTGAMPEVVARKLADSINREWSKIVTGAIASTIVATAVPA